MAQLLKGLIVASLAFIGCATPSQDRFDALEQQVKKMQDQQLAAKVMSGNGPDAAGEPSKVDGLEASTNERFKKLEDMIELLQRAISDATGKPAPTAAAVGGSAPAVDLSADINGLVGVEENGVEASGDSYAVKRGWLIHEIQGMAAQGKGPKVTPAKPAGVAIKGIKPKSFIDQLGIKNGDVITAVGDVTTNSVDELAGALRKISGPVTVKIQRKKKEVVLQYSPKD